MKENRISPDHASSDLEQGEALPEDEVLSVTDEIEAEAEHGEEEKLFEKDPLAAADFQEPEEPAQAHPDTDVVKSGAEFGMTRFCEQSFINPESARLGSQALLTAFDDSGLWLASLVQPVHLVAELRQHCCLLTRVVVTQWTRQGETHKLVRLAEALVEAQPPVVSHEAGQILALLASLLGILRPAPAPRWLEASRPLLRDSVDPHLMKEAAEWVAVGQMLATLPQEDRLFWNRRLRDPEHDWDWENPEALDALRRIALLLPVEHESLLLFQTTVPRCWWELWRDHRRAVNGTAAKAAKPRSLSTFALGLGAGIGCMMLAGWWMTFLMPAAPGTREETEQIADEAASLPAFSFHAVETAGPPPASAMVAASPAALPVAPLVAPVSVPEPPRAPPPKRVVKKKAAAVPAPAPLSPAMQARMDETLKIAKQMPELIRLHSLVRTASLREAMPHVQGRTMIAAQGTRQYRALLRWLMLDPPVDAAVREQVSKAAVRVVASKEMYDTLQLCLHPGSPNLQEARECASLLLALGGEGLNEAERQTLMAAATLK